MLAFAANSLSNVVESGFLINFLKEELITILIALLAINTTTGSIVMTKLRDISDSTGVSFSSTIRELRLSIFEQLIFIIVGIVVLVCLDSKVVMELHSQLENILNILLISVFIASLHNLYDTASSIFIILEHEESSD